MKFKLFRRIKGELPEEKRVMKKDTILKVVSKAILSLVLLLPMKEISSLQAQGFVVSETNGFEWRLIGRVFFDAGAFFHDKADLGNGVQINDLRLGTRIHFLQHWNVKMELGYGDEKVSIKDVYINYEMGNHEIRLGYYHEPFGIDRVGSTNFKFIETASADKTFGSSRKLGVSYLYNQTYFNFMGGVFSDGNPGKANQMNQGYTASVKFIGRPVVGDGRLLHLAIAPRFSSHGDRIELKGGVPTTLLSGEDNRFVLADVTQAINQWKMEAEVIGIYRKWYFEGHYLMAHINRAGLPNYNGQGGYVQGGYLILGEKQNYNPVTGMVANPAPKSLEILCRYNLTNLNDAGITGGKISDITVGMNYFLNRYIAARLNYVHVMTSHNAPGGADDFDLIQGRIQFSF